MRSTIGNGRTERTNRRGKVGIALRCAVAFLCAVGLLLTAIGHLPARMLVDRAITAHGGARAILRARWSALSGTVAYSDQDWRPEPFAEYVNRDISTFVRRPGRDANEFYVGTHESWAAHDGIPYKVTPAYREMRESVSEQDQAALTLTLARLSHQPMTNLGWERLPDGRWEHAVRVRTNRGLSLRYLFSPISGRIAAVEEDQSGAIENPILCFSHYKSITGLLTPLRWVRYENGVRAIVLNISHVTYGSPPAPEIFLRPEPATGASTSTVTVDFSDICPAVYAKLNGRLAGKFLLSPMLPETLIFPVAARKLGLIEKNYTNFSYFQRVGKWRRSTLSSLALGNARVDNLPVLVGAPPAVAWFVRRGYSGTLGTSYLAHYQLTIDYASRRLILAPRSAPVPAGSVIPLTGDPFRLYAWAQLNGEPCPIYVEPESTHVFIPSSAAKSLRFARTLPLFAEAEEGRSHVKYAIGRLHSLQVGRECLNDTPVAFDVSESTRGQHGGFGVLGADFLNSFRVTIDYAREKLILVRSPAHQPDPWTCPGVEISRPVVGGPATVWRVDAGSPAAVAGLTPGEHVLSIDGIPTSGMSLLQLRQSMRGSEGSRVTLQIGVPGKLRTYTLRRVRII